ncbi:hypothetical protein CHRYSEOSP005_19760 [Chryseobacterium sp. Alg-005]|uniref:hypothetical protein n=1 Tax=Chryseobacterium sp. Alg-005 TaxID=3159516 RepID=UPI0035557712
MKTINKMVFISILLLLVSCNGQNKDVSSDKKKNNKMIEKFDFEEYKKRESAVHIIKKHDTVISMMLIENKIGTYTEIPPKPSFKTIYKEFYANGNIKKKETFIGEKTKVDTSEYYDENGNVEKVDENKKFGKIKPEDALKFLETKKIINFSTGKGRFLENGQSSFEIHFDENKKEYTIVIEEGKPNTPPFDGIGEPPAFLPLIYTMDGETGKIKELK